MSLFTNQHKKYWASRRIDWNKAYTSTYNHPHRFLIAKVLKTFNWISLFEIGCGSGANLIHIVKSFSLGADRLSGKQLGGCDVSEDAIAALKKNLQNVLAKVGSADDIMMSDDSTDVVLSDAVLIYVDPFQIKKYVKEMKRIARNHVVLCEFHSTSFWKRLRLRLSSGYHAYNWKKLLKSQGFYDVSLFKIPKEVWPGTPWEEFGYLIKAKVPRKVD